MTLEQDVQAHIARQPRDVYDEIVSEVVATRFFELLEKPNGKGLPSHDRCEREGCLPRGDSKLEGVFDIHVRQNGTS